MKPAPTSAAVCRPLFADGCGPRTGETEPSEAGQLPIEHGDDRRVGVKERRQARNSSASGRSVVRSLAIEVHPKGEQLFAAEGPGEVTARTGQRREREGRWRLALLLRLALGGILAVHGAKKLFGSFGRQGISGTTGWLEMVGMRPARAHTALNGFAEFEGGALLVFGLLTPSVRPRSPA